jgi:uncharacterized protein YgiM (DUF1202 family)
MTSVSSKTGWRRALARAAACALLLLGVGAVVTSASAQEKVQITDPYIELHTGAGRGFPIFFVAERGEWIEILLRHTDWFKVRTANGQEGWVNRAQLETTLTEAGTTKAFRDILLDDYLRRRLELGAAWGQFDGAPMLKIWSAYRFADALSFEATVLECQPECRAVVGSPVVAVLRRGPWPLHEYPKPEPRQRDRHHGQSGECGGRPALAYRRTLCRAARLLHLYRLRLGQWQH